MARGSSSQRIVSDCLRDISKEGILPRPVDVKFELVHSVLLFANLQGNVYLADNVVVKHRGFL